jgi:polyferredoxin
MILKKICITLAIAVFTLFSFYFLNFANILPNSFIILAQIQLVLALLSGSLIVLLLLLLLTLILGRIYCSVICPLGIFQDTISWFSKRFTRKKKYKFSKYALGGIMQPRMDFEQGYCNYNCTVCSHVCPTQAVKMIPYKNDLTIPSVNTEICIGYGGCEHI